MRMTLTLLYISGGSIKKATRARRGTTQEKGGRGQTSTGRSSAKVRGEAEGRGGEKKARRVSSEAGQLTKINVLNLFF